MTDERADLDVMKTFWARAGLWFEFLALAVAIWVAIALVQDDRKTTLHAVSLWAAVAVTAVPTVRFVARRLGSVAVDSLAAIVLVLPILGSFTIGGLALAIPALFLVVAAALRYLGTVARVALRRAVSKGFVGLGTLLFLGGAVSMGPGVIIAPVGLLLVLLGVFSLRSAREMERI